MSGGKGGTQTQAQSIPAWVEGPAKENLARAKAVGEIGYMPYYGPDVAALAPQQEQAMRNTFGAQQAYGMIDPSAQFSTGMPQAQEYAGGVRGYSSGNLFDQAVAELAARQPDQVARYGKVMNPNINPEAYTQAVNAQLPNYAQSSGDVGTPNSGIPNYWAKRELEVGPAQAFAEQSAQNQKINDALTSFSKMGFMNGILGAITGGTPTQEPATIVDRNTYTTNNGSGWNDSGTGVGVAGGPVGAGGGNASRGFSYGGW